MATNYGLKAKCVSGKMSFFRNGLIVDFSTFNHKDTRTQKMARWVESIRGCNVEENKYSILIRLDDALPEQ